MTDDDAIKLIRDELVRARKKFPWWPDERIHAAAVVGEEAGELLAASLQHRYENGNIQHCLDEAVQTGAMAVRYLVGR